MPEISDSMDLIYSQAKKMMWTMVEYKDLQMLYTCAMKEVKTKFEVLSCELGVKKRRNPISSVQTRLKSTESIMRKLQKDNLAPTVSNIEKYIHDFAGIRIICSYIDDIYDIADAFLKQDDVTLIERKDYINTPKENGYRSLHLIVSVPVFFTECKKNMTVEVQIRTIAMDFWASLEHQIKYKRDIQDEDQLVRELRKCAETIAATDVKMLSLRQQIELAEDIPTEDEELIRRVMNLDAPL